MRNKFDHLFVSSRPIVHPRNPFHENSAEVEAVPSLLVGGARKPAAGRLSDQGRAPEAHTAE